MFSKTLLRCKKFKREAQKELYEIAYPDVYKVCLGYSSSNEEAVKFTQSSFILMFNNINEFKGKDQHSFIEWAKSISTKYCIQQYKNRNLEIIEHTYDINEEISILGSYDIHEMFDALHKIDETQRIILSMHILGGFSHSDIAKILKCTEQASKSNLHKAKINFVNKLELNLN